MARRAAKSGIVELQGPGGAAVIVAHVSEWTLDETKSKIDVTGMDDGNVVRVLGLPDVQGTLACWWDDANFFVQATADYVTAAYTMAVYPIGQIDPTHYHIGAVWLDYNLSGGVTAAVALKATWVAAGTWLRF